MAEPSSAERLLGQKAGRKRLPQRLEYHKNLEEFEL
jgi:hypothetical protein